MSADDQRHSVGPLALWIPFLLFLLAILYWKDGRTPGDGVPDLGPSLVERVAGFEGALADGSLRVRVTPLRADPEQQLFETGVLARRWDLGPGEPWRLDVLAGELAPGSATVQDAAGTALRALEFDPAATDPFAALASGAGATLVPGRSGLLWGRPPEAGARLELFPGSSGSGAASVPLEPREVPHAELPRHLARWEPAERP